MVQEELHKNGKNSYISHDAYLKKREYTKVWNNGNRMKVLSYYSNGKFECVCCGENTLEFLTINHIDGGGRQHKKSTGGHIYEWLIRNEFPEGFNVLCMNCNFADGMYGVCPHVKGGELI